MESYDSPTFLGRKDKIALGMTMGQLTKGIGLVMGLLLFWLLLIDQVTVIGAGVGFAVSLIGAIILSAVKISGVKIPSYVFKATMMMIRRPAYAADAVAALEPPAPTPEFSQPVGDAAAEDAEMPPPKGLRKLLRRGRGRALEAAKDKDNQYMAKAQADAAAANAMVEGRRQLRSLAREFRAFLPRLRR